MTYTRALFACCLCAVFGTLPAHAHHAAAAVFTDEEIEGVVTEFNFKNPHVNIMLNVLGSTCPVSR